MKLLYDSLDTGDLLLFRGNSFVGRCVECLTYSKFSHIGMVLKDPTFIREDLTGLYLWQSGKEDFPDAEDHVIFYGVQISPLDKVISEYGINNIFVRKLTTTNPIKIKRLKKIHDEIHHHSYDLNIIDWIMAGIYQVENWSDIDNDKKSLIKNKKIKTPKTVWCSALIGYIYYRLNLISNPNWKLLSPQDWSIKNSDILDLKNCTLSSDCKLKTLLK